jgi:seryl-tRNA(Sec) selenium transferase
VLALTAQSLSASQLSARLHRLEPPIISRIANNEVLLDLRTILEHEDSIVTRALSEMGMPSGETS